MSGFLKQYGLPECLHTLTSSNDIPDGVWTKIEEFQKKGAAQNFSQAIAGAEQLKQMNTEIINESEKIINAEEQEDTQLRNSYGANFNRPPSSSVNGTYKQQIFEFKQKLEMAQGTDTQIKQKFEANTEGFKLLSKTRQDLAADIPSAGNTAALAQDPSVLAVKQCLDQLDNIKKEKEKVMNDGVSMIDNMNAIEDFMKVKMGAADKGTIMEQHKAKFVEHFAQNEAFENQKKEIASQIMAQSAGLNNVLAQAGNDPQKNMFFQQINEAIIVQEQLSVLLEQGTQFYMKLQEILIKTQ